MVLQQVGWLKERHGWIAMLMKTAVARKILRQTWKRGEPVGRAAVFAVDAMHHFGAAVHACLLVLPVQPSQPSRSCDVFDTLEDLEPTGTVGYHDGMLIADVDAFMARRHLLGCNSDYVWRSGIKHDCAGKPCSNRMMIVPQQAVGGDTSHIQRVYPAHGPTSAPTESSLTGAGA